MKLKFNYYMPTRIIFGAGELNILSTTPYLPGKSSCGYQFWKFNEKIWLS